MQRPRLRSGPLSRVGERKVRSALGFRGVNPEAQDTFWAGVGIAASVATALSTLVTLIFSTWWRRIDKHSAEWSFLGPLASWDGLSVTRQKINPPRLIVTAANAGDGAAYRVQVFGVGCRAEAVERIAQGGIRAPTFPIGVIPVVPVGGSIEIRVLCEPSQWQRARVAITWREQAAWRRKRSRIVHFEDLSDMADLPEYQGVRGSSPRADVEALEHADHAEPLLTPARPQQFAIPSSPFGWLRTRATLKKVA